MGDKPGVTRAVMTSIRVSNNPLVYLVDTPGIMVPNISDMHVGLKLALCCKHFLLLYISNRRLNEPHSIRFTQPFDQIYVRLLRSNPP